MSEGRKTSTLFLVLYCVLSLLDAVTSVLHLRALLQHGYQLPVWYVIVFAIHLLSCPFLCVATWLLWQERLPLKTRGLLFSTAFLIWTISKAVWFWRVGIVDCLIFALALGQLWFYLAPRSDSSGDDEAPGDPAESK